MSDHVARVVIALIVVVGSGTAARADGIYLGVRHHGVVHFDGQRVRTVTAKPPAVLLATGKPGTLWIAGPLSVFRFADGKLEDSDLEIALALAATRDDVVWIANNAYVASRDASGDWHRVKLPHSDTGWFEDFALDGVARAWIIFGSTLQFTRGDRWTTFAPPADADDLKYCRITAAGDLYLFCQKHVFRLHDNLWATVATFDTIVPSRVHVADDGTLYSLELGDKSRVAVISRDGTLTRSVLAPGGWPVRDFAVDSHGRIWMASSEGLAVFDGGGKRLRLPRSVPAGQEIDALAVDGAGPRL